jgi:peptide/nickel transport system substrate-binding protein
VKIWPPATLALLMLVACTQSQPGPNTPKSATFVVAAAAIPVNLDVKPFGGEPMINVETAMMSQLFVYDTSKLAGQGCSQMGGLSNVVGDLANSWTISTDRKTVTVKLKNAKSAWGHVLTADDVVYSLNRAFALSAVAVGNMTSSTHYATPPATAVSQDTVQLHIDSPTAVDLAILTHFTGQIYDSQELKQHATSADPWANQWLMTNTADFGPWKLESFQPGSRISFVPNPYYTGSRGNITHLIFEAVPDSSTRAQVLSTGQAQWATGLSYGDFKSLQGTAGVTTKNCVSPNRDDVVLNMKDPHFANVLVRQAISMAINRQEINLGAYQGLAQPSKYGLSAAYDFTRPSTTYNYDPAQAKTLLAQAGYANGFPMQLTYSTTRPGPQVTQSSVLIKDELAQIGINVTLVNVASASEFSTIFYKPSFQAILYSEPPAIADPYYSATTYTISTSAQDQYGWKDLSYDQLILAVGSTQQGPARQALIQQLAIDIVNKVPMIYLEDTPYLYAYSSKVTGFNAVPYGKLFPSQLTVQ